MSQQQIKQRNLISALQKREICLLKKDISKPKNADLARQFGISPGQVTDILKESVKWLAIDPNSYQAKLKKARPSTVTNIEEALIIWIEKALEFNLTITGSLIQQKALKFAEMLERLTLEHHQVGFKSLNKGILFVHIKNTANLKAHQLNKFRN